MIGRNAPFADDKRVAHAVREVSFADAAGDEERAVEHERGTGRAAGVRVR